MKKILVMVIFLKVLPISSFAQNSTYHLIKKTVVGGEGGWDYLSVSSEDRRLYLSHGTQVEVLNADTHEKIGVISDTKGVHGIVAVPLFNKGFITCGRTNSVVVFDLKTLKKLAEIPTGEGPDALLYDKYSAKIFIFNHKGGSVTAIDPVEGKAIGTIKVGGSAVEAGVTDEKGTIYVNLEDTSEIVAFNAKSLTVKSRWKVSPGEEPTGLAVDLETKRLITVCGNKKMIILDSRNGKVVTNATIGDRCDGVVFDPISKNAFSSNGEGTITVVHEDSPDKFNVTETIKSELGARTIAYDAKTHHIFTITAQYGETPAKTTENPRPRPAVIKDSFMILEYGN